MDTPDPTRANAALWSHYIDQEYGRWLQSFGGVFASGMLGIGIANIYGAIWGEAINRAFIENAPAVNAFVRAPRSSTSLDAPAASLARPDAIPAWTRDELEKASFAPAQERQLARAGAF